MTIAEPKTLFVDQSMQTLETVQEEKIDEVLGMTNEALKGYNLGNLRGIVKSIIKRINLENRVVLYTDPDLYQHIQSYEDEVIRSEDPVKIREILKVLLSLESVLQQRANTMNNRIQRFHKKAK